MRTVIVAMPVADDVDIFDVAEQLNVAFPHDDDSLDCVVFENVAALLDNLGVEDDVIEAIVNP